MNLDHIVNIEHLRQLAKRRAPRFIFDMIEGGVDDEDCVRRNESASRQYQLLTKVLVDIDERDQSTTLLGRRYASPFGIAPTGPNPIYRRGADEMLARAAARADVPFVLSGASGTSLETIRKIAPEHSWYQLYGARDRAITADVIQRCIESGYEALVYTVDSAILPKRERHLRNRITLPLKITLDVLLRLLVEGIMHPAWAFDYVRGGGMPMFENWQPYAPSGANAGKVADFFRSQRPAPQTWADLEIIRQLWPGKLVVKGVLNPADATRLVDLGADGIAVSNHGGKNVDRAPSSWDALPAVKAAVGDRAAVIMDGGIRRGSDIAVARCLGADFVLVGRATLYGVTAAGQAGAEKAIEILRTELDLVMATLGCPKFDDFGPDNLFRNLGVSIASTANPPRLPRRLL